MAISKRGLTVNDDPYAMDDEQIAKDRKGNSASFWRPTKDRSKVRILPLRARKRYYEAIYVHYNIGVNNRQCLCPEEMGQGRCLVCAEYRRLVRSPREADKQKAKNIRAKQQWIVPLVDLDEPQKGVQAYRMGIQVFSGIEEARLEEGMGNIFSPKNGRNITIVRVKKGQQAWEVEYKVIISPNTSPIENEQWLDDALEVVDAQLIFTDEEKVKLWLSDEEEESPARKPSRPAVSTAAVDDDDEDDEDDAVDDEDDALDDEEETDEEDEYDTDTPESPLLGRIKNIAAKHR